MLPDGWNHEPLPSSLVALVCIRAGALFGMFVRNRLPKGHLDTAHQAAAQSQRSDTFVCAKRGIPHDQESAENGNRFRVATSGISLKGNIARMARCGVLPTLEAVGTREHFR